MGAHCSKPASPPRPPPRAKKPTKADRLEMPTRIGRTFSEEEQEDIRLRKEEKRLHEVMRREQNQLSDQVRGLFKVDDSWDTCSFEQYQEPAPLRVPVDAQALRTSKRHLRKSEKLAADAKQQWVIYSSPDLLDEEDLGPLTAFIEACRLFVPDRKKRLIEESASQLDIIDEDTDRIQVRSQLSDMSIVFTPALAPVNSAPPAPANMEPPAIPAPASESVSSEDVITVARRLSSSNKIKANREGSLSKLKGLEGVYLAQPDAAPPPLSLLRSGLNDYELPKGYVSSAIAAEVVEVYRRGGRLGRDAVHKIVRLGYRSLKALGNTVQVTVNLDERLTVVGDIHGQLEDLLHILGESGLPSRTNKYVFNGDFVDRGSSGVEVMCILLALYAAWPQAVTLNRGNHEDYAICCVYGFQKECIDKYDETTFGMFCEVFQFLPLFTVLNKSILVVHGGLFHSADVLLSELAHIQRHTYTLHDLPEGGETLQMIPRERSEQYFQQLQRDALWSDPSDIDGIAPSARGAGVNFGADLTTAFLRRNGLVMLVRSHECVPLGFDQPFRGEARGSLCTVFSASNYGGGGNQGAYMVFGVGAGPAGATAVPGSGGMHYSVFYFDISKQVQNDLTLHGMILGKKAALLEAFRAEDVSQGGLVRAAVWTEVMQRVVGVKVQWQLLMDMMVPPSCMDGQQVKYEAFLADFEARQMDDGGSLDGTGGGTEEEVNYFLVESIYAQGRHLEEVFRFFDEDNDGLILLPDLIAGCQKMNEQLPPGLRVQDPERIMRIINADETGEMDMNEFFETFRMLEQRSARRPSLRADDAQTRAETPARCILARASSRNTLDIKGVTISVE